MIWSRLPVRRLVMATVLTLAGCVVEPAPAPPPPPGAYAVVAPVAPPPPRVEVIPVAPGPTHIWAQGHWHWDGREYVWVSGRYLERPHYQAAWEPGHWEHRGYGWSWIPGHWR